jgi:hypothetical protein
VDRAEKRELVTGLNEAFSNAGSVVVAHYAGITVAQMNDLRSKMRVAGGTVKVAKNRLARIALQGTGSEGIIDLFKGQTLVAYSDDPITAPKVAADFAKGNDRLVILGGAMGTTSLDAEGEGTRHSSLARRAARQAGWHDRHAGNPDRQDRQRAGGFRRARDRRLCPEGRGGMRLFLAVINTCSKLSKGTEK